MNAVARIVALFTLLLLGSLTSRAGAEVLDPRAKIRPFMAKISESALVDHRRRLREKRWPDDETVTDLSQGVQLGKLQELAQYWRTKYDWHEAEAALNAPPQIVTTMDGVDIHIVQFRLSRRRTRKLAVATS